ncbi:MAG: penicillin-binding protein activator [Gammaproteobacteria bacterium]|nr:MAG: penicillin-binding protein activator [Gammaproteobacteria bacterium]UCH41608.1 MAG: penicillin-binding protein activator [Gammaproteobacteria bacterium]
MSSLRQILLLLTLGLALAACQSGPPSGTVADTTETARITVDPGTDAGVLTPTEEDIITAFEYETSEQWLEAAVIYDKLAQSSIQPERSAFLIKIALMYYYGELYDEIEPFFEALGEQDILQQDLKNRQTILAGAYLGEGKIYQGLLALPEIDEIVDYQFKALALNIRSRGVLAIGKPMESARLRMQIGQYLKTPQEIEENHEFIWAALNRITESTMVRAIKEQQTQEMRGWLELNLIARRSNMLPAKMEPWIDQWYQRYGDHPAAPSYAINLLEESKRVYINPTRIALMLPFSGRLEKVADAIQNGFLYAYYQDPAQVADLEIINASTDPAEFNLQYEQAIQNGADFVVGPISKDLIDLLQQREELPVPTLTLNYGNDEDEAGLNLYQFGLRPEDEAEQIADYALAQGKHHAAVLVPDTDWGYRLQRAFSKRFEALGGQVVGSSVYPARKNDYSAAIKNLLNLTTSNHRKSILQQVIKEQVQFDARRRQDVDMIFIAANSRQARLIKPQLKFHHAHDLPVYATSHISSSVSNPDDDRDLNEILFVDIPWMLNNQNNPDYKQVSRLWPQSSQRFSRLFALGIDAYRMIPSLRRLMINPEETMLHNTGELSVDKNGRVHRSLLMATYENGRAKLLKTPNTGLLSSGLPP